MDRRKIKITDFLGDGKLIYIHRSVYALTALKGIITKYNKKQKLNLFSQLKILDEMVEDHYIISPIENTCHKQNSYWVISCSNAFLRKPPRFYDIIKHKILNLFFKLIGRL